jgi:hypothetical protein
LGLQVFVWESSVGLLNDGCLKNDLERHGSEKFTEVVGFKVVKTQ